MKYLSVCSGIEAASVAWKGLEWEAAGFSEIEPFPCAVLNHHFPTVTNFGDLTKHEQWKIQPGSIDIICGGTPCQSFSVAGLRAGMADPRGNLALTFLSLCDRIRPEWIVWENVPGVLSSNGGRDFGAFLGALAQLGYGFAYRILDAQYFGVAQRRRRVFVVANARDWRRAAAVLFEPESLRGISAPKRGQNATAFSRGDEGEVICKTHGVEWDECGCYCAEDSFCPYCEEWTSGLHYSPADEGHSCCGSQMLKICGTLSDGAHMGGGLNGQDSNSGRLIVDNKERPRRLTPRECERLQGFPDDWTAIPYRGKPASDGPRYKAIGNSMAVPVMKWIGERIAIVDAATKEEV